MSTDLKSSSHAIEPYNEGYALTTSISSHFSALEKPKAVNERVIKNVCTVEVQMIDTMHEVQESLHNMTVMLTIL